MVLFVAVLLSYNKREIETATPGQAAAVA